MMSEQPLISVIVPVYNVEKYLRPCVESILEQTYKNIEVILVNDGSTIRVKPFVLSLQKKTKGSFTTKRQTVVCQILGMSA